MSIIKDKEFPPGWEIEVQEDFISVRQEKYYTSKGKRIFHYKNHTYYQTLFPAVKKMARIIMSKTNKVYTLAEFVKEHERVLNDMCERIHI